MEYTDQEIEMLARFHSRATPREWESFPESERRGAIRDVRTMLTQTTCLVESQCIIASAARLMREASEQGRKEGAAYHADDVVQARSPLAASCVRQGVSAQAAANAFEYELHELTQEFIRYKTNAATPIVVAFDAVSADLIKKAREQGAAEMRERAALVALQPDICPVDGPVAAERIRAIPLEVPK